jgi:HAD superfamily hydrolase (TIGR01490 family)
VAARSSVLALFDLDCTLLEGDSEALWSRFLLERGIVDAGFDEKVAAFYQDYERGRLDFYAYQEHLLQPLTVNPVEVMICLRSHYLDRIRAALRPQILERVHWHRSQGHKLLLVTATNSFLAGPIAALLEFPGLICTQAESGGNAFTGRITGTPAFREGKVIQLKAWLDENRLTLKGSWGYSDSHNDLPLLTLVDHPVAVTPDIRLRRFAREHRWETVDI